MISGNAPNGHSFWLWYFHLTEASNNEGGNCHVRGAGTPMTPVDLIVFLLNVTTRNTSLDPKRSPYSAVDMHKIVNGLHSVSSMFHDTQLTPVHPS